MKLNRSTLAAALLASSTPATFGLVVPVLEDSFSAKGKLTPVAGKGVALTVSSTQTAYVKFDLGTPAFYAPGLTSDQFTVVTLRIYIGKAKTPGSLSIHSVTSAWSEATASEEPSFDPTPIATVAAGAQTTKDYVDVDITEAVRNAFDTGNSLGFAIVSDAGKLTIPSKEGVLPACQLNMEINYGTSPGGDATFGVLSSTNLTINTGVGDFIFGTSDGVPDLTMNGGFGGVRFRNALEIWPSADAATAGRLDVRNTAGNPTISLDGGAGKVGIGIAAPEDKLHISDPSDVRALVSTEGSGFAGFRTRNSLRDYYMGLLGAGSSGWTLFDRTAGASRIFLESDGDVGIGSTTPEDKLHISAPGDVRALISTEGGGFAGLRTRNSLRDYYTGLLGAGSSGWTLFDRTAGASRIFLESDGDVGIGTTAPASKLDVRGDIKLGGSGQFFAASSSENLSMVRGAVLGANAAIVTGGGFTVVRTNTGRYTITYSTPFSSDTVVTANAGTSTPPIVATVAGNNAGNTTDLTFKTPDGTNTDPVFFTFITLGPR